MFEQLLQQCVEDGSTSALRQLVFRTWNKDEIEFARNYLANKNCIENNSATQTLYGFLYTKGYVVEQNFTEALQLFDKAIGQFNIVAMKLRALAYINGTGCLKDISQAIVWLKKAFDLSEDNDLEGKESTARCIGKLCYHQKNYKESLTWFDKALSIPLQSTTAMLQIAVFYKQGFGSNPVDEINKAWRLLDDAVELNCSEAMLVSAKYYLDGVGGRKNIKKAMTLLKQACALGNDKVRTYSVELYNSRYKISQDELAELYFELYRINKDPKIFNLLYYMAGIGRNNLAQTYLIRINLNDNPVSALNVLNNNIQTLTPMLYQQLSSLMDKLPDCQQEIAQLQQFIEKYNPEHESIEKAYFDFKSCLKNDKVKAFLIFESSLEHTALLNSSELFEMASMTECDIEHLSPIQLTHRRERACELYYLAFEKSNDEQYLRKLLHTLRLMETGQSNGIFMDIHSPEEEARLSRFIETLNRRNQQSAVKALNAFVVTTTSYLTQNLNPLFRKLSIESLNAARLILEKLNGNLKLIDILDNPALLSKIAKPSPLYTILDDQFNGKVNPLHFIMSVDECKAILTQENSGELIYKALIDNKIISTEGLKILARHKEKTITYMKNLPHDETKNNIESILKFADDKRDPAASLKQYFAVQRGLFKPRAGRGSYKELEHMRQQMSQATL